ncbi:MAG: hypothetical protein BWY63_00475 [Chloroflexi bacterium ADurb.Bin360]|nr:MAG: hypothetical protein BWY63_00475 [Chloroflexi bacterium ADurb.Bin360]
MEVVEEDLHFYIDYAPPEDVYKTLKCLSASYPMSTTKVFDTLEDQGMPVRSRRTETLRRLFDLGLANQSRDTQAVISYTLNDLGIKLCEIDNFESELVPDLLHYLHYSSYNYQNPESRKYLWSYRQCSIIAWHRGRLAAPKEMAAEIQSLMMEEFKHLDFTARIGARFDSTAVNRWKNWVDNLSPPPFNNKGSLERRQSAHYELAALALDDLYRHRHYRYGDPVIIDETLLDELSRIFFLDPVCCRELLDLAARLISDIKLADTFAGTSVTLMAPYTIERI